jgi:molecular chaperone DnaK
MTAVAIGAAIFAESRDWNTGTSQPKRSRTVARTEGPVEIEYGYPERTADSRIRIRVRPGVEAVGNGYRLQVDNDMGWTSGQLALDVTNSINDVPVEKRGDNHFRAVVFDAQGNPIPEAETRFVVKRVDAAASGTPLTHTIAVKIVEGPVGAEQNVLWDLYEKGQPLPAKGMKEFRAAKDLKLEDNAYLDFEVYQREPGVSDPQLCLHVGAFPIESSFLERGEVIRRGDSVYVYWTLDENGLLDCELEIKGQAVARRFKTGKMFTVQRAKQNFEGPEGVMLAKTAINTAKEELDELQRTLGSRAAAEVAELEKRIERQKVDLGHSYDADTSRSIAEEGRAIRQEISRIKGRREYVGEVLRAEAESLIEIFDTGIRPTADTAAAD